VRKSENKSNIFINKYIFIKNIKSVGNKQDLFSFLIRIIRHVQNQYFKAKKDFYHHAIKYLSSEINSWVKVDINIFCWKTFLRLTNSRTSKEEKRGDNRKRRMTMHNMHFIYQLTIPSMKLHFSNWESLCNMKSDIFYFYPRWTDTNVPYLITFFFPSTRSL